MSNDFESFLDLMRKKDSDLKGFEEGSHPTNTGQLFFSCNLSEEELGICYSVSSEFLILTSSYESLMNVFNKLYE